MKIQDSSTPHSPTLGPIASLTNAKRLIPPIEIAKEIYERKRLEAAERGDAHPSFEDTLIDHLRHGIVRSTITCFAMAMPMQIGGKAALLVRCAVGKLRDMAVVWATGAARNNVELIAFARRGHNNIRIYSLERFMQLTQTVRSTSNRMNAF